MLDFALEKSLFEQGHRTIAAIDEAGRGPLAGPVVAACVIFKADFNICSELKQVKDSKKLLAKKRAELCQIIKEKFLACGIGLCDNKTIDKINILQASFLAMKKALGAVKQKPDIVILDGGFLIPNFTIKQQAIVRGDEKIFSIAAASIVAKVTRDNLMRELDQKYPQYGFAQHKGYGTKLHLERLKQYGPCPIHRLSFNHVV
ncbi:ribonuclease HII [Candidatus Falkowbacteria bacterium CG_4_9_14_3_um_filter_38_19]|uniref:Ribonuclease HII n=2 Tax=Candidatus Falkowiibacteriota TaxID=1752728 RepID=A0A2M6WPF6_9BACT|nr:ribonuclease HII [Candidatus Falkowbacteria bacterium]PIT94691.1 MAG: ribonuclease HII [Candidatus Falkowbacteria bacterium CG10_big_fil_rev_8_21_14_0_10_38_22]PJB16350.1 MAG: ribonuclease HII [Candidatus Falkowbacteria bacterium CG_4_9_14_3_um_filter_38_19]